VSRRQDRFLTTDELAARLDALIRKTVGVSAQEFATHYGAGLYDGVAAAHIAAPLVPVILALRSKEES
jgi:hypothetical protein